MALLAGRSGREHRIERFEQQESIMPILLWLLGVPISLIIVLMLLGAA
jgi:hypothetical protein